MSVPFDNKFIISINKYIEENSVEKMHRIAMACHARLVARTPVDLGQARAGWNFAKNARDETVPPKPPKGTTLPPPKTAPKGGKAKFYKDKYHISNFVAHVVYLNEGHSTQAPSKFIEAEIRQAIKDVESGGK